jgi:TatD DNase family protein
MTETRPPLIDIGVNLTHRRFEADRDAVIARAREAGIEHMILTGIDGPGSAEAGNLAATNRELFSATAGVHPHHARDWDDATATALAHLAANPTTVAIGETGLDFNRDFSPRPAQEAAFHAQLAMAVTRGLPAFLHQRDAHERFLAILDEYLNHLPAAVVHCFTGGKQELKAYLDRDLHIGVTGWVCDERRGSELRSCVPDIPANRLMIETDAPFLLPRDIRPKPDGGRNEPAHLPHIAAAVASLRGESVASVAANTTSVARRFFGFEGGQEQGGDAQ